MSSYVIENQSRGVGAIASQDLGAVSRASGSAFRSKSQSRSALRAPAQVMAPKRIARNKRRGRYVSPPKGRGNVALRARMRRGSAAKTFIQGRTGISIEPSVKTGVVGSVDRTNALQDIVRSQQQSELVVKARPIVTVPAGVVRGPMPSRVMQSPEPCGSLPQSASRWAAHIDAIAKADITEAQLQVPQIAAPVSSNRKLLIAGGIGVAAIAIYFIARKGKR